MLEVKVPSIVWPITLGELTVQVFAGVLALAVAPRATPRPLGTLRHG